MNIHARAIDLYTCDTDIMKPCEWNAFK